MVCSGKSKGADYYIRVHQQSENIYVATESQIGWDSNGQIVVSDAAIDYGRYDASWKSWYDTGSTCGIRNNSLYGNICMSSVYVEATSGFTVMSLAQALYNSSSQMIGVIGIDISLSAKSSLGVAMMQVLPSVDSEMTIVQPRGTTRYLCFDLLIRANMAGEVIFSSNQKNEWQISDGTKSRLNVLTTKLPMINSLARSLTEEYENFTAAKDFTSTSGHQVLKLNLQQAWQVKYCSGKDG